ncbi:MAG TPA: hypothetical protein VFZ61_00650 [Polyangiales bacterium]
MRALLIAAVASGLLLACSKSEAPAAGGPAPAAPPPAAPAPSEKAAAAPTPSVEDKTFKLALVSDPEYTAGAPSKLKLVLEARGGYHVNQDYPIRVDLKAPLGVKLDKTSLGKADAAEFGEPSAKFELPFTAQSGSHQLTADVDFAVCTPETCMPDQRKLAIALNVK